MKVERTAHHQLRNARPVIIGGIYRSGTSLLRALVASHPNLAIPTHESGWWTQVYPRHRRWANARDWPRFLTRFFAHHATAAFQLDLAPLRAQAEQLPPGSFHDLFALVFAAYANAQGKARWGDKTPFNEFFAREILTHFPHAQFIHMLRDPRDVFASRRRPRWPQLQAMSPWRRLRERLHASLPWVTCNWRRSAQLARELSQQFGRRYLVVRYEALVADPHAMLRHICAFLDEPYSDAIFDGEAFAAFRARGGNSSFERLEQISRAPVGRYLSALTPREIALCEQMLGAELTRHGYTPARVTLSRRAQWPLALIDRPKAALIHALWHAYDAQATLSPL